MYTCAHLQTHTHTQPKLSKYVPTFNLFNFFKPLGKFQLSFLGLSPHWLRKIPESLGICQVQHLEGRHAAELTPPSPGAPGAMLFSFMAPFISLLSFGLNPCGD